MLASLAASMPASPLELEDELLLDEVPASPLDELLDEDPPSWGPASPLELDEELELDEDAPLELDEDDELLLDELDDTSVLVHEDDVLLDDAAVVVVLDAPPVPVVEDELDLGVEVVLVLDLVVVVVSLEVVDPPWPAEPPDELEQAIEPQASPAPKSTPPATRLRLR